MRKQLSRSYSFIYKTTHRQIPASGSSGINKSSTFLSGYCTPQEGYIEPFIPAASCGVFWKVLDKKEKVGTPEGITTLPTLPVYSIYGCFGLRITGTCGPVSGSPIRSRYFF